SRRRHTSWPRDWSSDVCSSDLHRLALPSRAIEAFAQALARELASHLKPGSESEQAAHGLMRQLAPKEAPSADSRSARWIRAVAEIGRASCRKEGSMRGAP